MDAAPTAADVVQKLLAEVRRLKVENEGLRSQVEALRESVGKPDPLLQTQETEIVRLRAELESARDQRDIVTSGARQAVERLRAATPPDK